MMIIAILAAFAGPWKTIRVPGILSIVPGLNFIIGQNVRVKTVPSSGLDLTVMLPLCRCMI